MSGDTVAPTDVTKDIFRRLKAQPENKICFDCPKAEMNFFPPNYQRQVLLPYQLKFIQKKE